MYGRLPRRSRPPNMSMPSLPPGFIEHRRKARREMLLAWRSMIDAALERMDGKEKAEEETV